MIVPQTRLKVADNTGAKEIMCIRVMTPNKRWASVGDLIKASVKVAQPNRSFGSFAHDGKRFRQQIVECFTRPNAALELVSFCPQRLIAQCLHLRFQIVDRCDHFPVT